jgi:hypothetical protein
MTDTGIKSSEIDVSEDNISGWIYLLMAGIFEVGFCNTPRIV